MKGEGSSSLEISAGGLVGESSFRDLGTKKQLKKHSIHPKFGSTCMKSEKKELKAFSLETGPCTKDQEMKRITYSGPGEGRDYIFRWQGFGKKERNLLV